MANLYFQFKQFTVWQDKCAMKVGTDGVLLGAWAPVESVDRILDIGTGTGLIALMLAQRSSARITAIEIDKDAHAQALENIERSAWKDRIEAICADFKSYSSTELFDLIVSNPPYFVDSLQSLDEQRTMARHNRQLTYRDLLHGASALLKPSGTFALIIPTDVASRVIDTAISLNLFPHKQTDVITAPGKLPKRCLIAFGFSQRALVKEVLLIEKERHVYSDEYIELTRNFYLKM